MPIRKKNPWRTKIIKKNPWRTKIILWGLGALIAVLMIISFTPVRQMTEIVLYP